MHGSGASGKIPVSSNKQILTFALLKRERQEAAAVGIYDSGNRAIPEKKDDKSRITKKEEKNMVYTCKYQSPLGDILLAADEIGLPVCGLKGRNILQIRFRMSIFHRKQRFLQRQKMAEIKNTSRMSAQAVGGAVGHNKISIIIPCHRVVGTNGSLTGYAGGIDKKISLLELEHADMSHFFVPKKGTAL